MDALDDLTLTFNFNEPIVDTQTTVLNERPLKKQLVVIADKSADKSSQDAKIKSKKPRKAKAK